MSLILLKAQRSGYDGITGLINLRGDAVSPVILKDDDASPIAAQMVKAIGLKEYRSGHDVYPSSI